jgi:hypothetical protein
MRKLLAISALAALVLLLVPIATSSAAPKAKPTTTTAPTTTTTPPPPPLSGYEVVSRQVVTAPGPNTYAVACPAGKKVLGGGFHEPLGSAGRSSFPSADGSAWNIYWENGGVTVTLYAVCADGP